MGQTIKRKLAAIMFTDIAGYTAQMSKDENAAINLLNKKESILKPLISNHNGTYVKGTGDGSLSYFNSAVDAALCAKKLQESIYDDKDLNVRIGVHLGDTIFEKDGDIRGEGVNIAARLESMAIEGGVFISKEVQDQLINQKEFDGISLGLQSLKGVGRLIEVYGLKGEKINTPNPKNYKKNKVKVHTDNETPSIAIIPFENKGHTEDEFYAYGISADLIKDCSSAGLVRVASLKDIEKLDYGNFDNINLSEKLFVRYIAQGTLWKIEEIFQLSIELYDTKDKKVIWADRWQEKWDNLPTIKVNLSEGLMRALNTRAISNKKIETNHIDAYEYYLKAKYRHKKRKNKEDINLAKKLINKAISIDDNLIIAKNLLGKIYKGIGTKRNDETAMKIFNKNLKQAKAINDNENIAYLLNKIAHSERRKKPEKSLELLNNSLKIYLELNNKVQVARVLQNIGNTFLYYKTTAYTHGKPKYNKALNFYNKALNIAKELDDKLRICLIQLEIANVFYYQDGKKQEFTKIHLNIIKEAKKVNGRGMIARSLGALGRFEMIYGSFNKAQNYFNRAYNISKELGNKAGMALILIWLSNNSINKKEYDKALGYVEESIALQKEVRYEGIELWTKTVLFLSYKKLGIDYNKKEILELIQKDKKLRHNKIHYEISYLLYSLLEDNSYLKDAYNYISESNVLKKYELPKAIIKEYKKVFK